VNQYRRACEAPLVECPYFRRFLTVDGQTGSNPSWTKAGFTNGWKGLIGETTRAADSICQQCVSSDTYIRPSPFSILQIAGQGAGRASRALPRYRLPGRCAAVLPAAREESQGLSRSLSGIRKHKLGLAVGDTLSSAKIGSGKPGAPHFCLRTHARPFFAAYAGLFPLGSLRHLQGSP
jgi:hypothetical protein